MTALEEAELRLAKAERALKWANRLTVIWFTALPLVWLGLFLLVYRLLTMLFK
jgi:hypothetical protein